VVREHVLLCCQTENGAESASSWYRAESVIVIADTVFTFSAHVLPLRNQAYFTLIKFPPFSLYLLMETACENMVLWGEQ